MYNDYACLQTNANVFGLSTLQQFSTCDIFEMIQMTTKPQLTTATQRHTTTAFSNGDSNLQNESAKQTDCFNQHCGSRSIANWSIFWRL